MAGMLDLIAHPLCHVFWFMLVAAACSTITHMLLKSITARARHRNIGVLLNLVMGDQFLSIIMNASIYKDE